jgi:REP element-mobilizing transposase RayT
MPQSLAKNYIHIIFSTKQRQPLIPIRFESEIHRYLSGTCERLECNPVIAGGCSDHVHILCLLSKKIPLVSLVGQLKAYSSKWIKTKDESLKNFYWQDGYGAFSVNPSEIDTVKTYIKDQHNHHQKKTFQDEYRIFLKKYNVEYDERYVWD